MTEKEINENSMLSFEHKNMNRVKLLANSNDPNML